MRISDPRRSATHLQPEGQVRRDARYILDPDGYIIEVGQSKPGITYG
jgi:hypothetical protein